MGNIVIIRNEQDLKNLFNRCRKALKAKIAYDKKHFGGKAKDKKYKISELMNDPNFKPSEHE
jgi:uncharacterized protein YllA (UPF0747 family)